MKYINASEILPDMLVEELQQYVQAGYIYIPAKDEQHKSWGELSGYRKELNKRNEAIIDKYQNGASIEELADEYYLSVYAIRKIIYQKFCLIPQKYFLSILFSLLLLINYLEMDNQLCYNDYVRKGKHTLLASLIIIS